MRLGQFARKYDIRLQDLISYLEGSVKEEIHSNTKLSEETEKDVLDFFGLEAIPEPPVQEALPNDPIDDQVPETETPKESEKDANEQNAQISALNAPESEDWDAEDSYYGESKDDNLLSAAEEIEAMGGEVANPMELASEQTSNEPQHEDTATEQEAPSPDEVIQTDQLLEMLESEASVEDLQRIKLIKAPKRELAGLKVLGKVDLPEPVKKPSKSDSESDEEKKNRHLRKVTSEEEKEKKRLKAKRKKEAFEARQEKKQKAQEAAKAKKRRAAHYQEKLDQQKAPESKTRQKLKKQQVEEPKPVETIKQEPKSLLGKLWRWFNT